MVKNLLFTILGCFIAIPAMCETPDVSDYENIIYPENIVLSVNEEKSVSFYMKTTVDAVGYQFDLVLPEGVEIVWDKDYDDYALEVGSLTTYRAHTIKAKIQPDGSYRVLCSNTDNKTFKGRQGEVAVMTLKTTTATAGTYPLILKNIEITKEGGLNSPRVALYETSMTISSSTGVEDVTEEAEAAENTAKRKGIYNLAGQQVNKLHLGELGIQDGIKVIGK